jgi:hypothetical protein
LLCADCLCGQGSSSVGAHGRGSTGGRLNCRATAPHRRPRRGPTIVLMNSYVEAVIRGFTARTSSQKRSLFHCASTRERALP